MFINKFGAKLKKGKNLEVLQKLRNYFYTRRDKSIVRYYQCRKSGTRKKLWVSNEDLEKCTICGKKLYNINKDNVIYIDEDEEFENKITQKKHIICFDTSGKKYFCCYGISSCFKRIEYNCSIDVDKDEQISNLAEPPSFNDFLDLKDFAFNNNDIKESLKKSYNSLVYPFLNKWMYNEINKFNLKEFMEDISNLHDFFVFFEEGSSRNKIRSKIYKIIGVQI